LYVQTCDDVTLVGTVM